MPDVAIHAGSSTGPMPRRGCQVSNVIYVTFGQVFSGKGVYLS